MADDLETSMSHCQWYWSDNVGETRGGNLKDLVVYFFREEKSMIFFPLFFSPMIELNLQLFLISKPLHSDNLTIMLIVIPFCYNM